MTRTRWWLRSVNRTDSSTNRELSSGTATAATRAPVPVSRDCPMLPRQATVGPP